MFLQSDGWRESQDGVRRMRDETQRRGGEPDPDSELHPRNEVYLLLHPHLRGIPSGHRLGRKVAPQERNET